MFLDQVSFDTLNCLMLKITKKSKTNLYDSSTRDTISFIIWFKYKRLEAREEY